KEILWAVAGTSLIRIDPRAQRPQIDAQELPDELGPLRSVRAAEIDGRRVLLIGARSGVMAFDPAKPAEVRKYAVSTISSQLGFNAVAWWEGAIWATHREAGLVRWESGSGVPPLIQSRDGSATYQGVGNLCLDGESRLVYSRGDIVCARGLDGE